MMLIFAGKVTVQLAKWTETWLTPRTSSWIQNLEATILVTHIHSEWIRYNFEVLLLLHFNKWLSLDLDY